MVKEADKAKMSASPKGADVPNEMNQSKADHAGEKFVKIDPSYTKAESTPLTASIQSGANSFSFDVK